MHVVFAANHKLPLMTHVETLINGSYEQGDIQLSTCDQITQDRC